MYGFISTRLLVHLFIQQIHRNTVSSSLNTMKTLKTVVLGIVAKGQFGRVLATLLGLQHHCQESTTNAYYKMNDPSWTYASNVAAPLVILAVLIPQSMKDKQIIRVITEFSMQMQPPGKITNTQIENSEVLLYRYVRFSDLNEL